MGIFCRFPPFSGCFCTKTFSILGGLPIFLVTTIPNPVAHRNIRRKVFLEKQNDFLRRALTVTHTMWFFWVFFSMSENFKNFFFEILNQRLPRRLQEPAPPAWARAPVRPLYTYTCTHTDTHTHTHLRIPATHLNYYSLYLNPYFSL